MKRRFKNAVCCLAISMVLPAVLAGCGSPPVTDLPTGSPGATFTDKESPMLSRLVNEHKLPPLAERLPIDPMVVKPLDTLGEYGGTWHTMVDNPDMGLYKCVGAYAPLMRWKPDCNGIEPGLATDWEYNKDGTQLTIHLRRGVKWSDGAAYTSADLAYWADVSATKRSQTVRPFWTLVGGRDMTCNCPDKYTFVMKFAGPNWYVPLHMATGFWESEAYQMPRHYLIRFDPRYNPEYKDFGEFDIKSQTAFNPDRPSLCPWHLTAIEDGGFRMVLERNPYYFMTDTAGRQLPYIDKIICEYVPDPQIRVLKILSGEIDGQFGMMDLRDLALYVRGQKPGRYRLLRWQTGDGGQWQFSFNWSAPDPVIRSLIRDVRFREALSLAVDRDKCNQVALFGLAVPQQATISAQAWHFRVPGGRKVYDNWAKAYSRFDIAAANKLLDRMGLTKRDSSGFRLRPDGRRLSLLIDLPPAATEDISIDEATIVADGWRRLGIDVNLHNFTSAEFSLRMTLGKCEVTPSNETDMDLFTFPDWVFPTSDDLWHPLVGKWYATGGKQGEPPSGITKRLLDIYARILGEKDMAKSQQLILDAVKLETKQGFFCIGTVGRDPALVMAKENMGNVPTSGRVVGPWATPEPALSYPETFFFSSGARPAETGVRLN